MARRITLAALATLLALGIVLVLALSAGLQRERLRAGLEGLLARALGEPVTIGALEGPLVPAVALRDVRVGDPAAPWLTADRMALRIRPTSLFYGELRIASLVLDRPRIALERSATGTWNAALLNTGSDAPPDGGLPVVQGRLRIDRFALRHGEVWLDVASDTFPLRLDLRLDAHGTRAELPLGRGAPSAASASLDAALPEGVLAGRRVDGARLVAKVEGQRLRIDALGFEVDGEPFAVEPGATLTWDADALDLGGLAARVADGRVECEGALSTTAARNLRIRGLELDAAILAGWSRSPVAAGGRVDAEIVVDGAYAAPRAEAHVVWADARAGKVRVDALEIDAAARPPDATLTARATLDGEELARLALRAPYEALLRGGLEASDPFRVDLDSDGFELALLAPFLPSGWMIDAGTAVADVHVEGGRPPRIGGQLELTGLVGSLPVLGGSVSPADASLVLAPDPRGVRIEALQLHTPLGSVDGEGTLGSEALYEVTLRGRDLDAARIGAALGLDVALGGTATARLALDGRYAHPEGTAQLRWTHARLGQARRGRVELDASARGANARIALVAGLEGDEAGAHLDLRAPYDTLRAGRLRIEDPFQLTLRSDGFELAPLAPLLPPGYAIEAGLAKADLHIAGGRPATVEGRVEWSGVVSDLPRVGRATAPADGHIVLAPDPRGVRVDSLSLDTPLGSLRGSGTLAPDSFHEVALSVAELDPAGLSEAFGLDLALGGAATARVDLEGRFERPQVDARLDWAPALLGPARVDRATLRLTSDAGRADAALSVIVAAHEVLTGSARAHLPEDLSTFDPLGPGQSASLRGDHLDVSALRPLLPRQLHDLSGRADLQLDFEGALPRPHLTGILTLADGRLSVPVLGTTWAPIVGAVRLEDDAVVLESLQTGEGALLARGRVELADLRPSAAHLTLALRGFPLARSPLLTTDLNGDLVLDGPVDALVLSGSVSPRGARVRIPEPDDPLLREIEVIAADASREGTPLREQKPPPPGALDRATADVRAEIPRDTWLRGRGLDVELEGDLQIQKSRLGPVRLAGDVRAVRGHYRFQGKRFDVERGIVTFDGAAALDPLLDIDADHRVRDVIVKLHLEGRASEPILSFSSEPELDQEDVLSYLFFGRPANETSGEVDFASAAAGFATGIAVTQASQFLEMNLPVDTLDVRMGEGGEPEEVGVGAYVLDDLFVHYGRTFGSSPVDRMSIEYRINENWSVESEMSSDRNAGADLIWSRDF